MSDETLDYIGPTSFSDDQPKRNKTRGEVKDESDLSTLEKIFVLLENRREYYQSIESINWDKSEHEIKIEGLANRKALFHLQEIEHLVKQGISKVREDK